jgi:hypothetical protein
MSRPCCRKSEGWAWAAVLAVGFLVVGLPLPAQTCDRFGCGLLDCATPAHPVPASTWNLPGAELQPVDPSPLPPDRDATNFNEFLESYYARNWYEAVDFEKGTLITALGYGLRVWDAGTNPASPILLGILKSTDFPYWNVAPGEFWPLEDVDAPDNPPDDSIAALAGRGATGIAIVSLADKTRPRVLYQNHGREGRGVYSATIGGVEYAFLAASNPGGGVFIYNMGQARQYAGCSETAPDGAVTCPGVYVTAITRAPASYIHGVDHFIVFSSGTLSGFEIWDVADPQHPKQVLTGLWDPPTCLYDRPSVYGVAMWKDDATNKYYLGLRMQKFDCAQQRSVNEARIYDVSCITGTCTGLGSPLNPLTELTLDAAYYYVTFSKSGNIPFLYFGSDDRCAGGYQREWLFDVSSPASPHEVTAAAPGYWSWYYRGSPTGFNYMSPRRGKFNGAYFYRAGLSILDIHHLVTPVASFDWMPNPIYASPNPVTFNDLSTGWPTTWTWTITDVPASSASPTGSTGAEKGPAGPPKP